MGFFWWGRRGRPLGVAVLPSGDSAKMTVFGDSDPTPKKSGFQGFGSPKLRCFFSAVLLVSPIVWKKTGQTQPQSDLGVVCFLCWGWLKGTKGLTHHVPFLLLLSFFLGGGRHGSWGENNKPLRRRNSGAKRRKTRNCLQSPSAMT